MNCPICNKQFSRLSNLNKHQKTSKCSNMNKCSKCNQFFIINIEDHIPTCSDTLLKTISELQATNERYVSKITTLQDKIEKMMYDQNFSQITILQENIKNMTHESFTELKQQVQELTKKVEAKNQKQEIHIHNNINIDNLQIINTNDFDSFSEFLTIDHIKKGAYGYAEYAINYPLNNKIVCTDFSRRKLKYKTDSGKVKNDINLISLSKDLFKSIHIRNKELIFAYGREYIETIKDPEEKMNAYCKFMNYFSLIKDGSQGIHHELYTDFVKQICTMSNNK